MIWTVLGALILLGLFAGLSVPGAKESGWRDVVESWALTIAIVAVVFLGVWLISLGAS